MFIDKYFDFFILYDSFECRAATNTRSGFAWCLDYNEASRRVCVKEELQTMNREALYISAIFGRDISKHLQSIDRSIYCEHLKV